MLSSAIFEKVCKKSAVRTKICRIVLCGQGRILRRTRNCVISHSPHLNVASAGYSIDKNSASRFVSGVTMATKLNSHCNDREFYSLLTLLRAADL